MEHHEHDAAPRVDAAVGSPPVGEQAGHDMSAAGHDRHEGHSVAMFRDKFGLSLALTIPTVLLSAEVAGWIGYTIPSIPGIEYLPDILGTVIFVYGGLVFIRGAQGEAEVAASISR
jgi:Cu2+-exporting ATPase